MNRYPSYKPSGVKWLGKIPSHWEVKHLRNFLTLFSEKGYGDCQLLSVTREKGVILRDKENKEENHNFVPDDLSGYKHLKAGDFVINKMKSWQGSYGVSDYEGIVSPAYFTCKLKGVNPKFFSRAIRSKAYIGFFMQYSKGIRVDQWDLDPSSMKDIPFILPTDAEQSAITNYLDTITAKIDAAIAQQQKMIDLLNERKQIIINRAVTRGLNPNARMKDSGVEWIGEVPEHWEVSRLRNYVSIFSEKGFPNATLLSVTREHGVILRSFDKDENHNYIPDDLCNYKRVLSGDFVINKMKAWQGSCGVSEYDGIVSPAYFTFKLRGIYKPYFSLAIRSKLYTHFFMQYSKGIRTDQWDLEPDAIKNIPIVVPTRKEQVMIVERVSALISQIEKGVSKSEEMISLLQERKQIVINEVVTGKVKVSN